MSYLLRVLFGSPEDPFSLIIRLVIDQEVAFVLSELMNAAEQQNAGFVSL